ncbi:MAG: hypothetical protein ACI809_002982, partial [Candidatus Azotimanducaceae bacterium]
PREGLSQAIFESTVRYLGREVGHALEIADWIIN